jgi:soluble lytic murein transglycosylase
MKWYGFQFALIVCAAVAVLGMLSMFSFFGRQHNEHQYDLIIAEVVQNVPVDPELVRAIIWKETRFNSDRVGSAGERGLMQVTPIAAEDWAAAYKVEDFQPASLMDPATNIAVGSWYIGRALYRWHDKDDPVPFALAEYNAGRSRALRWVDPEHPNSAEAFVRRIDYPGTSAYIGLITKRFQMYKREAGHSDLSNWFHHLFDNSGD